MRSVTMKVHEARKVICMAQNVVLYEAHLHLEDLRKEYTQTFTGSLWKRFNFWFYTGKRCSDEDAVKYINQMSLDDFLEEFEDYSTLKYLGRAGELLRMHQKLSVFSNTTTCSFTDYEVGLMSYAKYYTREYKHPIWAAN